MDENDEDEEEEEECPLTGAETPEELRRYLTKEKKWVWDYARNGEVVYSPPENSNGKKGIRGKDYFYFPEDIIDMWAWVREELGVNQQSLGEGGKTGASLSEGGGQEQRRARQQKNRMYHNDDWMI